MPSRLTRIRAAGAEGLAGLAASAAIATLVFAPPLASRAYASPRRTARIDSASAATTPPSARPHAGAVPSGGLSVGSPTDGHLVGGAHLDESPWLRVTPCYENADVRWGLGALVSLIDHGARNVRKEFPDSVLSIGHLSRRAGGDVDRHASHESGRDADVGFYITNQQGKPIYAEHFVPFLGDGTAPTWPGAKFDDARNWAFVSSIVSDGRARVSYVFVASPLRARLLAYAQKIGAPYAVRVRASQLMAQPRGSLPHDDHFHVRISCPSFMEECVEYPTRNVARAKAPRTRSHAPREVESIPSVMAHGGGSVPSVPAGARTHTNARPLSAPDKATPDKAIPETQTLGAAAPSLPAGPENELVPGAPAPAPAAGATPPALLDTPIDDVDGVVE